VGNELVPGMVGFEGVAEEGIDADVKVLIAFFR
jgi:hypothetical protein